VHALQISLQVYAALGEGLVAGTFFAIAVSVFPTLIAMEPMQYLWTHRMLGKGYHPVMPLMVSSIVLADAVLAGLATAGTRRTAFVAAALLMVCVSLISQFGNVPLNKAVARAQAEGIPSTWSDPRPSWQSWHRLRLAAAVLALLLTAAAMAA
jgi:uncharacterized membrane protein